MPTMLALLMAQTTIAATPPPVQVLHAPPPVLIASAAGTNGTDRVQRVNVRVTAGSELLWQGELTVSRGVGARYSQEKNDAAPTRCADVPSRRQNVTRRVAVSLSQTYYGEGNSDSYSIRIEWTRPADLDNCTGAGDRTIQMTQNVSLPNGQSITVDGDAGLHVVLTRKD